MRLRTGRPPMARWTFSSASALANTAASSAPTGTSIVARIHELTNAVGAAEAADDPGMGAARREALEAAARLSAPMMPHLAEELWAALRPGKGRLVAELPWLEADPALLAVETATLAVQVLGKLRATIEVPVGADEATVFARAEAEENVRRAIGERPIRKRIHVPGRVVNFVV